MHLQQRCAGPARAACRAEPARVCHLPNRLGRPRAACLRRNAVVDAPRRAPSPDPPKKDGPTNPIAQGPTLVSGVTVPNTVPAEDALQDLQDLKAKIASARAAMLEYSTFSQEKVDAIFKAAAAAASASRVQLAVMAVEETGMGCMEDKVIKNHFASEFIYNKYKDMKTCGVIENDAAAGIQKVAEPVGVIAGIVPTTNPTSTAIFKSLLALKTRNAIVMSPHVRATNSTIAAAKAVRDAAEAAGAPKGLIQWIDKPSHALATALMRDPGINLILATGGPAMVRAAYESGHPSIGVGAGNTPAVIDDTADIQMAVSSVLLSKTFDNGVICASEQSLVVMDAVYDKVVAELKKRGAYIMSKEEAQAAGKTIIQDGRLNAAVVGQRAVKLADLFGFKVPSNTKVLVGEAAEVGRNEPLSFEKLCPVLGLYRVPTWEAAVKTARSLVTFGGAGHTSCLYTCDTNKQHIADFQKAMETVRILINSPASQGAIGDVFNFHLDPSLTLGCGSWGSTSVSANVGPQHLLNIKTTALRQENMLWFRVPPKVYFKRGCLELALKDLKHCKRAFVVSDPSLFDLGMVQKVTDILDNMGMQSKVFCDVEPDPTLATVERAMGDLNSFRPDVIIAVGGGSPMDAAKLMWLMYEHPNTSFMDVAARFMDIRKRINAIPALGQKAQLVAIPSTSGTGSEVTPFAVVTDHRTGIKYPLADYALTPSMAICDANLVLEMPRKLTAYGGLDALVHALESYVSAVATDYTRGLSMQAVKMIFKYLPRAYHNGAADPVAREKVHNAATIAGMAFANAFLGICHSMAHKLGGTWHVPHGLANSLLISHVIRYNSTDAPYRQATFSQYTAPDSLTRYAELADMLGLGGSTREEKVIKLIEAIEDLKRQLDVPATIKEVVGADKEQLFMASTLEMAYQAFDDQCTGANPRYPLVKDLRKMLEDAWSTPILPVTSLDFESPSYSCLKMKLQPPTKPAGTGAS